LSITGSKENEKEIILISWEVFDYLLKELMAVAIFYGPMIYSFVSMSGFIR